MSDAIKFEAPVVRVTLLEDRARVVRRGTARLTAAGRNRLTLDGVAPVIVDKTIATRVIKSADAEVVDVRVSRRRVAEAEEGDTGDERKALVLELRERRAAEKSMSAEIELIDAEADGLSRLGSWTLGELADDVSRGRGLDGKTLSSLGPLTERERELKARSARSRHELSEHQRASSRLENRIQALATPATRRSCQIAIDLEAQGEGDIEIEIEYVAPGAMWRPAHTATLMSSDEGDLAAVATSACVWQNTGEEWREVDLFFSTERASLGAEPPALGTDMLAVRKRQEQLVVETREQEVNVLSSRGEEVEVSAEMPGIDDGGQTVLLSCSRPVTVESDGRMHRFPLGEFEAKVAVERWAHPELSTAVVFKTTQTNLSSAPLLAGPVELIRAGGWVGRTSVGFIAAGEEFELSWGADPTLRAKREVIYFDEESRALSSWYTREQKVVVRLSNLGREPRVLEVRERVPVSEIEKVKIEIKSSDISDGVAPDDDGFITWRVELAPHGNAKLELRYKVKRHGDVVGV